MLRKLIVILFISFWFLSCENEGNKFVVNEEELPDVDIEVNRYGKALFELDTNNLASGLKSIKPDFPLFLGADLDDTANIDQIRNFVSDTALIRIFKKSIEIFPDNEYLNYQLTDFYKYLKYYFPDVQTPEVFTYISGLQYESPVWVQDTIVIIGLDLYLTNNFMPYYGLGLPKYKIDFMNPEKLVVDVAKEYYNQYFMKRERQNTLLDRMVAAGKLMYYLDMVLPFTADSTKISYTADQLNWLIENEKNVWAFLIDNDLLFSTDYKSQSKLMVDGPFTQGFSKRSPARIGVWVGWQIVSDFMENNPEININQLLEMSDSQKLLHASKYKP